MPWEERNTMSLRMDFVQLARKEDSNVSELCRRFGISRKTGHKWLTRYEQEGAKGLEDRSRRPHHSPERTEASIEAKVLSVRSQHTTWGGRKILAWLDDHDDSVPISPNTVTAILHRNELVDPEEARKHRPFQRFKMERPNELWQMDFKGYFALEGRKYCHPLTILDDHSRFLVGLRACPDETRFTVQMHLSTVFRQYGLPDRMLMDNGSPWGDSGCQSYTILTAWLIRLGIIVSHGHPYHPQTQGKDERLHRTLKEELLNQEAHATLEQWQQAFDPWREMYNYERPHEALGQKPPASRYTPSNRPFPDPLLPIVYNPGDFVRTVDISGRTSFKNRVIQVGKAFRGQLVAIRPTEVDGQFGVYYCRQQVGVFDLRDANNAE